MAPTLDDFTKAVRKVVREEVAPIREANKRLQGDNAFYQGLAAQRTEELHTLQEAIFMLTSRTKILLQKQIYADNKDTFRKLGLRVLQVFLEKELPSWNPAEEPDGIPYKRIASHFPEHESGTVRRRLNELSRDPRKLGVKGVPSPYNCSIYGFTTPPLQWKRPGFYMLNTQLVEATAR